MKDVDITIAYELTGRSKKGKLIARLDGETYVDKGDINEQPFRKRFIDGLLKKWPSIPPDVAELKLDECVNQVISLDENDSKYETQSDLLVKLAEGVELFHDTDMADFATVEIDSHCETMPVHKKAFKQWLQGKFWFQHKKVPCSQSLQDALGVLSAKAVYEGPERKVFVRTAEYDNAYWLDLANDPWQVIKITSTGWEIVDRPPVKFIRPRGVLPLPTPVSGGNVNQLRNLLNIENNQDWVLILSWLIAAIRPVGPYPLLVVSGEQGSGKSTAGRILRYLIDPNASPLRSEPKNTRDLMIAASNSAILGYDNFSHIPSWLSDALCRLSTGGGFSTRELYADAEEIIFDAMRPVIVNGISELATRSDLLDRAITISLPTILEDKRITEEELWQKTETLRPQILGALLDAMSAAMNRLPSVNLPQLPRMADFSKWAVAAEEALGFPPGAFLAAYARSQDDANSLAVESSSIGPLILELTLQHTSWQGTAQELLTELETYYTPEQVKKTWDWPASSNSLGRVLRRLAPNLRKMGVIVEFRRTTDKNRKRYIQLSRVSGNGSGFGQQPSEILSDEKPHLKGQEQVFLPTADSSDSSDNKFRAHSKCVEKNSDENPAEGREIGF